MDTDYPSEINMLEIHSGSHFSVLEFTMQKLRFHPCSSVFIRG
jgi:hypothetical protein